MFTWRKLTALRKLLYNRIKPPKILIVRNDGLGDLILTLPLVSAIKEQIPSARIYLLTNIGFQGLASMLPGVEGFIGDPGCLLRRHRKQKPADQLQAEERALLSELRIMKFDVAIMAYSEARSARLIHRANIPFRVGTGRRFYSWRFNLRNPYSRKKSRMAESWHNLQMLKFMGLSARFLFPETRLENSAPGSEIDYPKSNYIVMHPYKRSGTALVWPMQNFQKLAQKLVANGYLVVVIGDHEDADVLQPAFQSLLNKGVRVQTGYNLRQTCALIQKSTAFIGNSSGPLHLAALMQTPHVGFFPQNRTASPSRWKTLKTEDAPVVGRFLLSSRYPINCITCLGEKCPHYNCVASITVESVFEALKAWGIPEKNSEKVVPMPKAAPKRKSTNKARTANAEKKPAKQKRTSAGRKQSARASKPPKNSSNR